MKRLLTAAVVALIGLSFAADASAWTPAQRRAARQNFRQAQRAAIRAQALHAQPFIVAPSFYQVPGTQQLIIVR